MLCLQMEGSATDVLAGDECVVEEARATIGGAAVMDGRAKRRLAWRAGGGASLAQRCNGWRWSEGERGEGARGDGGIALWTTVQLQMEVDANEMDLGGDGRR